MEHNSINFQLKTIDQNKNNDLNNNYYSNSVAKYKSDKNNVVETIINKSIFISFITSKTGIVIIISTVTVVEVALVLGVVLSKNNDKINNKNNNNEENNGNEKGFNNPTDKEEIDYVYRIKLIWDSIYIKRIENLKEDFILGMDISSLKSEEYIGFKYYNFNGEEKDIFKILRYVGINYIRVRIWNDSYDSEGHGYGGGNWDMAKAIQIGKKVTKYGMTVLASFH